ncbi:GDYXXLXY domain-containing protein [Marinicella meishanensis]|uniref:GDYXXLXY domain-containing protein n=1 Tax=Marinicella meishanensis TaxID=2873263 RepID=UPI001CBF422A|nr:GDYXXLXY domain-containing protein [Marinicella sp. NBU2979]
MSSTQLWQLLQQAGFVKGDEPANETKTEQTFWYIRALQGFAGWLAAIFLLGFLGFGIAGLFDQGGVLITLGLFINAGTYAYFKAQPDNDFFDQMVLAFSLTGQFLLAFGLFELFDFRSRQWLVLVALYQVVLALVMRNYLHRFLSTWFAVIALFWGFDWLIFSGLGAAAVAALMVWIWLQKTGWEAQREFYEPVGYALAFALVTLHAQNHIWLYGWMHSRQSAGWLLQNASWISALLNSAVLLYLVRQIAIEQGVQWGSKTGRLILLAAVLLLFSALPVIGLSSALLVLLVGYARQNKLLMVLGGLALLGFVSWYYYALNTTLLNKSLILMAMGAVMLLAYAGLKWWLADPADNQGPAVTDPPQRALSGAAQLAAWVTLGLALVGVNQAIWQKERLLATGQSVFLELAPVDPRSIMQGDYMRLRFALANDIRSAMSQADPAAQESAQDGLVFVHLDERGVGRFHGLKAAPDAAEPLIGMQYRWRHNRVQFATNAFFFQEGDAQLFDAARFGEFKVAGDGELLLKAMYDAELKLLGQNRLD